MANRYAVATGTWDTTNTSIWSATDGGAPGASAPTSSDKALLTAASGAITVTLGANVSCLECIQTGFTGTLDWAGNKITVAGVSWVGSATCTNTGTPVVEVAYAGSSSVSIAGSSLAEANAVSFNVTAATGALTVSGGVKSLNLTGFTGSLVNSARAIYGSLTWSPTATYTAGTNTTTFAATSGTQVITSNGVTLDFPITVAAVGGTVQLANALTMGSTRTFTHTAGTFDANNKNVTTGRFAASGATTRVTSMGTGTWTILDAGATAWSTPAAASHTVTPSTSTVLMTAATAKTFVGGGRTFWNLSNGGAGALTITGANTFNDLQNTVTPATFTLPASTTTTVSALSLAGTAGNLVTLQSSSAGTRATLSKASGAVNVSFLSIKDIAATGGATWQAKPHNGNLDAGNNTGWTFPHDTVAAASMAMTAYAPGVEINVPVPLASMTLTAHLPSVEIIIPVPLAAMVMTAYAPTFSEEFLGSLAGIVRIRPAMSGAITVRPALSGRVTIN